MAQELVHEAGHSWDCHSSSQTCGRLTWSAGPGSFKALVDAGMGLAEAAAVAGLE